MEPIKPPFPWFGGKSLAADLIWSRFGTDIGNYVEPFFGSGAVLLNRPDAFKGWMTVNDLDGHVANFWRSVELFPEEAARAADNPVNECDLHARHLRLVTERERLTLRLMADPLYCEPVLAGWWAWGACTWIGSGWCAGSGAWTAQPDDEGVPALTRGNTGRGVNRQLSAIGCAAGLLHRNQKTDWTTVWFTELQVRLRDVRVACGDWKRVCSVGSVTRNGIAGVLLDPPYSLTKAVYAQDSSAVSVDVRRWCVANGGNKQLRIALCGHDTEHNELESMGWTVETWDKAGGYQGADDRERIWFSPACLSSNQGRLF